MNQKWALTALKKVAALPEEKRAGWRQAARVPSKPIVWSRKANISRPCRFRRRT